MLVFSNLAMSLDGKIASASREFRRLGTMNDLREMGRLRDRADAVLMGAASLRDCRIPCEAPSARVQPINVILSHHLKGVSPRWRFFTDPRFRRLIFVDPSIPAATVRRFEKSSVLVPLAPSRVSPAQQIVAALKRLGVRRLLVEGGGELMWEFARDGLIDEYHVTLTPWIVGGAEAPTLVDGNGFPAREWQKLRLHSSRRVGNELYLVYRRTP